MIAHDVQPRNMYAGRFGWKSAWSASFLGSKSHADDINLSMFGDLVTFVSCFQQLSFSQMTMHEQLFFLKHFLHFSMASASGTRSPRLFFRIFLDPRSDWMWLADRGGPLSWKHPLCQCLGRISGRDWEEVVFSKEMEDSDENWCLLDPGYCKNWNKHPS